MARQQQFGINIMSTPNFALKNASRYFQKALLNAGVKIIEAPTPIIPIFTYKTPDTLYFGKKMFEEGVYVNPVIAPACVEGECLLRTTLMATHTEPLLDEAAEIIARVLKEGAPDFGVDIQYR